MESARDASATGEWPGVVLARCVLLCGPAAEEQNAIRRKAPVFAVEVRSEDDYGPAAEAGTAAKRADYFEAGTKVVWDADPEAGTIASYLADAPLQPVRFALDDTATAEPAVPGWRVKWSRPGRRWKMKNAGAAAPASGIPLGNVKRR